MELSWGDRLGFRESLEMELSWAGRLAFRESPEMKLFCADRLFFIVTIDGAVLVRSPGLQRVHRRS